MDTVETIYLNIAGFNIQINLKSIEWGFAKKLKEKEINNIGQDLLLVNQKKLITKLILLKKDT